MFPFQEIGLDYAWWFPAIYLLVTVIVMIIYGKNFIKKFLQIPGSRFKGKIPTLISSTLFSRGLMFYAIVLPFRGDTAWFWIGMVIFGISIILYILALLNFATTRQDKPVTKGLYRYSRNPIQVLSVFMLIGIGLATLSWIMIAGAVLLAVISYPTFLMQERSCLEKYGESYHTYMKSTPRWIGILR